jgi:Zn-dependent protease/predicted transcriptional regulator
MFGKRITLFRLLGFTVQVDASWLILAILVTWSLATGLFPSYYPGLIKATYWWMGVSGAIGLFASIVFHEFCHSLVARRYGLPIKGITLFIFGGVAEMEKEPESPRTEFLMAAAGPVSSMLLAGAFFVFGTAGAGAWSTPVRAILMYLAYINAMLAGFNLLPAFPLDGGRVFRSALWHWKDNLRWATRIASRVGSGFGFGFIFLGVFSLLTGNLIGGIWWFLIGMFVRNASQSSYQQVLLKRALEGEPVRRFMKPDPVTVKPLTSLEGLVEDYVYRYHYKMFPVVEGDRLVGVVTLKQLKEVARAEWGRITVGQVAERCTAANTVDADSDALEAMARMSRTGNSRLLVLDGGRLVGILALKDLLKFLAIKMDFESPEG